MSVLDSLLEGFAAAPAHDPPEWGGRFTAGDKVRVAVKGGKSIVGHVRRPSGAQPKTHVVVAPEGGHPHVEAEIGQVRLDTPAQHAQAQRRAQQAAVRQAQAPRDPVPVVVAKAGASRAASAPAPVRESALEPRDRRGRWTAGVGSVVHVASELRYIGKGKIASEEASTGHWLVALDDGRRGRAAKDQVFRTRREAQEFARVPQRAGLTDVMKLNVVGRPNTKAARLAGMSEGLGGLLEAFAIPGGSAPAETPAQSRVRGEAQVAAAQKSLSAGWNASKHPRAQGGRFGYTTGGKRATRSRPAKGSSSSPRLLNVGARGALVSSIQRQLNLPASGTYDAATKAAVGRYQQQHHLLVDGIVGRQTLAAFRGHTNARLVAPGPIASSAAAVLTHPHARKARAAKAPVRAPGGGVRV